LWSEGNCYGVTCVSCSSWWRYSIRAKQGCREDILVVVDAGLDPSNKIGSARRREQIEKERKICVLRKMFS
jgi:hypothetical protein